MNGHLYNNIGIGSLSIAFVLQHTKSLSLSKILLIIPFITNAELLKYLARKDTNIKSIEQLIVKKPKCFSNFNDRYYDGLLISINSIQFLVEIGVLELVKGEVVLTEKIDYDKSMGNRAKKIFEASSQIAEIIKSDTVNLYTNLRIQL
jgi:hypothetical protein